MKKHEEQEEHEEEKIDLRHDTMEFSAATDGDDKMDADDERREDDGISGEELDALEDDDEPDIANALAAVETDRIADEDNLPEESDEDDYYDDEVKVV